jgi:hypothetical protein
MAKVGEKRELERRGKRIIEKKYDGTYHEYNGNEIAHYIWETVAEFTNENDAELCFMHLSC